MDDKLYVVTLNWLWNLLSYNSGEEWLGMLKMSEKTRIFLHENCRSLDLENCSVNDILDVLDDMMLNSLTDDYDSTPETKIICDVYDDIYYNN